MKPYTGGGRKSKNTFVTKKGQTIKLNRSLKDRLLSSRDAKVARRAERLASLPKAPLKRLMYHLKPSRMYHYWFSRDGGIMALKIAGIGFVAGFILLVGMFAYFRKDLPNITDISGNNIGGSVLYYDRTGQTLLWEDVDGVKRIPVKDQDISTYIKQATVAVEDKDFFRHGGFDVRGIARAGFNDVVKHGNTQGGSTITQQLVRLTQAGVGRQQTITRKVKELVLAVELERSYTKQEILTGYLNAAPYGGIEYGAEAAARDYFQKSAKDLTLDEAAMLAAIPKSPSLYSKYSQDFDKQALISRQRYILDQMVDQKMITKTVADEAKKVDTVAKIKDRPTHYEGIKAPYFVLAAKDELQNQFGSATTKRGGWKVITTLDMNLQTKAEELVASNIRNASSHGADEQAVVAEDVQTGQIVSLVGGTDFNNPDHGHINYAHNTFIPPGSSFKPYDYTSLIENNNNVSAGSVLYDSQTPIPGYACTKKGLPPPKGDSNCLQDYDFLNPGPITLRYALGGSRNIPAVKAMLQTLPNDKSDGRVNSINKVISTASALMDNPYNSHPYQCYTPGVDINNATQADVTQCYGASAIGDGAFLHLDDHVNGIASISREGAAIPRTYILKVSDAGGKVISQWTQPKAKQVVRPDSAYIVTDMASDPNASYLPAGYYKFHRQPNGWKFAVKTGTTNNGFDGLMASWSTKYAVLSWVGNHTRNVELRNTTMEVLTAPLTKGLMEYAHTNLKPVDWVRPSDIKTVPAFVVRNHIHYGDVEPSPSTDLAPSWYTGKTGDNNKSQTIDIVSNKLATNCTPEKAKKQTTGGDALSFSIDIFVNGGANADTSSQDDIHKCDDQTPSVDLTASGNTATATVHQGTHPLSSDQFKGTVNFIDANSGQVLQSAQVDNDGQQVSYTASSDVTVKAEVIDSVLDSGTSPNTVSLSGGGNNSSPLTINTGKYNVSTTKTSFSWTGGSGTVTIYKSSNNSSLCSNGSSPNCTSNAAAAPVGTQVYAKDSSGNQSVPFTVN